MPITPDPTVADIASAAPATIPETPLADLIAHIQLRYHDYLRSELPRLDAMLVRVLARHGDRLPETLVPLQRAFASLSANLLDHMRIEDGVLFPFIVALERGDADAHAQAPLWLQAPLSAMEAEHRLAGAALATMRDITRGYAPPAWACPTFRGLYFGLAQLEADIHLHVHLENDVLFPRAAQLAGTSS